MQSVHNRLGARLWERLDGWRGVGGGRELRREGLEVSAVVRHIGRTTLQQEGAEDVGIQVFVIGLKIPSL